MDLKHLDKVRVELEFNKETAIQVFDGVQGWKLRPYLNREEVEPFSPKEMKIASKQGQLDGLLIDCAAKGTILSDSPGVLRNRIGRPAQRAARGIAYKPARTQPSTTPSCPAVSKGDEHAELFVAHHDRRGAHR